MIDIENEVYTAVRNAVKAIFPSVKTASRFERNPEGFPFVTIVETNNAVYRFTQDSGSMENHALINITMEVYSNKAKDGKAEVKAIASIADDVLARMGFTRIFKDFISNQSSATITRMVLRYRGVVGKDGWIYTQ